MAEQEHTVAGKTVELEEELKALGLWQTNMPAWVNWYDEDGTIARTDFAQWLQYVFIPNHLHKNKMMPVSAKKLLVPNAIKYFGDDVKKGKLLRILIEIDALL
ncbi:YqcC family protein [Ferruginibacter sp.]|nr:hypothetical protein [Ferruginibacter sp.]